MMSPNVRRLLWVRGLRAFGDGYVSLLLPLYLITLGLSPFQVGVIATGTLLGSGILTLLVGLHAYRFRYRTLLLMATTLMMATGLGFAAVSDFWPLLVIAVVGTLNPSSGDVSVFLPLEQAVLARVVSDRQRTAVFARYSLVGALVGAVGALFAGFPEFLAGAAKIGTKPALQAMFVLYGLLGLVSGLIYRKLPATLAVETGIAVAPLRQSKRIVYTLATLFSLDAFGGGFIVQSLLALWLFEKFQLSIVVTGTIFFWTGVLSAFSYLVAVRMPTDRPGQYDGVHASASERAVVGGALRSRSGVGHRPLARALRLVADGRADAQLLRHGGRVTGGTRCGRQHYVGSAKPCVCGESAHRGLSARLVELRLAAAHRGQPQDRLRFIVVDDFPDRSAAGGNVYFGRHGTMRLPVNICTASPF
jgi:MFS family permease